MKIKNCKVGQRVEAKVEIECVDAGATGTIIEGSNYKPFVSWDVRKEAMYPHGGHGNVWAVKLDNLRRIEE